MTLQQYLDLLGWTTSDLARLANINFKTAKKAVEGEEIIPRVAQDIAIALTYHTGQRVLVGDIKGLNVR